MPPDHEKARKTSTPPKISYTRIEVKDAPHTRIEVKDGLPSYLDRVIVEQRRTRISSFPFIAMFA